MNESADEVSYVPVAPQHIVLADELFRRYGKGRFSHRLRYWRKITMWLAIVGGARALKRLLDIGAALAGLVCLSPLLLVVALAIKLTDGGPVLFWQKRVGRYGREFSFPKFRSMVVNAEALQDTLLEQSHHANAKTFKIRRDPRVTGIGRIIRKLSIDELPQFWNILKGDMSLVGPRPPVPREVALYTLSDRRRLDITPGLTCIWQVSGRADVSFDQQVELDVQYIQSQSFLLDISLLLRTIPAVLLGRGAY